MVNVPILRTERLVLRPWNDDDRIPFAVMCADPVVMEYFPATLTSSESDAFVDSTIAAWSRGWGLWAVETIDDGAFIGYVGFAEPTWESHFTPCIEIGWRLRASAWGRGLATEGARAALDWACTNLEPPRGEIVSFTTRTNWRSRRVMESLKMSHDARDDFDHPRLVDHPLAHHVVYRVALEEWSKIRSIPRN